MARSVLAAVLVSSLVGCQAHLAVVPVQITSERKFDPSDRALVWGRAVTAFQMTGRIVALTDSLGGVLQSAPQRSMVHCTLRASYFAEPEVAWCPAVEFTQFTVSNDGIAFLRITRRVSGEQFRPDDAVVTPDNFRYGHQPDAEKLLDYIVGSSKTPPPPPVPPLSADVVRI